MAVRADLPDPYDEPLPEYEPPYDWRDWGPRRFHVVAVRSREDDVASEPTSTFVIETEWQGSVQVPENLLPADPTCMEGKCWQFVVELVDLPGTIIGKEEQWSLRQVKNVPVAGDNPDQRRLTEFSDSGDEKHFAEPSEADAKPAETMDAGVVAEKERPQPAETEEHDTSEPTVSDSGNQDTEGFK